jgi:SAM-dependent methyltransferase
MSSAYGRVHIRGPDEQGLSLIGQWLPRNGVEGVPERQSAHCGMVDAIFSEPRLAAIYDALDSDRSDLDVYASIVDELAAQSVLDLGCGTGAFACLLAHRGKEVTAVDPAAASVAVAQRKAGAERVRWLVGDAGSLAALGVDLVTMTGNVAQVFVTDDEWMSTLRASFAALRPGGHLVFEVRDPAREAWRAWNREESHRRVDIAGIGTVETWVELTEVKLPLVAFRWTFVFEADGSALTSESTLRFRSDTQVLESLSDAGFIIQEIRDAPDRARQELVFIAMRPEDGGPDRRAQAMRRRSGSTSLSIGTEGSAASGRRRRAAGCDGRAGSRLSHPADVGGRPPWSRHRRGPTIIPMTNRTMSNLGYR